MHRQTVDSILPLLQLIDQPAFCIRTNGTIVGNDAARYLMPACAASLSAWLGNNKGRYDLWDRTTKLQLSVELTGSEYSTTVQALNDGTLFLLTPSGISDATAEVLAVSSSVLRQPLTDLNTLLFLLEQMTQAEQVNGLCRQLYRLLRIVSNQSDLIRFTADTPWLHQESLALKQFMEPFLEEIKELCAQAERNFTYHIPAKDTFFYADSQMLRRALLNLISNALKFGAPNTDITLSTEVIGTHLVFQVTNTCSDDGSALLHGAFNRLTQRGNIPDSRWGMGLGLPIANAIARAHGGMVTVETMDQTATVTLSITATSEKTPAHLACDICYDYTGGMRQALLELSDCLPNKLYRRIQ